MTFHDELLHQYETDTYRSVRQLQIWLSTIAPLKGEFSEPILTKLEGLCLAMNWPLEYDKDLDRLILEKFSMGSVEVAGTVP